MRARTMQHCRNILRVIMIQQVWSRIMVCRNFRICLRRRAWAVLMPVEMQSHPTSNMKVSVPVRQPSEQHSKGWAVELSRETFHISCEERPGIPFVWPWKELARRTHTRRERGWKLFTLLPRIFWPPRGGNIPPHKLQERFDSFG